MLPLRYVQCNIVMAAEAEAVKVMKEADLLLQKVIRGWIMMAEHHHTNARKAQPLSAQVKGLL